jgi:hypothetical protein
VAPAIFVLQAIPECYITQTARRLHVRGKCDGMCSLATASPHNNIRGALDG